MEQDRATQIMVLLAVCQKFEMETENDVIPRIASAFAGGIGNTGAVCGAVIGAVMAIGLKQGRANTMEEALRNLAVAREFRRRFEAEMETISCRELTGADLSTEEGIEQFMSSDTPQAVCFPAVRVAYRLVVDLLK
ncbi:MAG: C_GCAxxG_C_C family protein [Deltaproteobacteria bacterium]|nr:C_GCAxxG_C_C family protein [Deltaproteobacteria bacterium]